MTDMPDLIWAGTIRESGAQVWRAGDDVIQPGDWWQYVRSDHVATLLAAEREAVLRKAGYTARNACLVPPDGGSPTQEEADVCAEAERRILALIDQPDKHPDDEAVDLFVQAMKTKLAAAREKGRGGWQDTAACPPGYLERLLIEHLGKGNPGTFEDVANFAMMLHQRGDDPQRLATALDALIGAALENASEKLRFAAGRQDTTSISHDRHTWAKGYNGGVNDACNMLPKMNPNALAALDSVREAEREKGFWAGRKCGGSKAEIDAALAAIRGEQP